MDVFAVLFELDDEDPLSSLEEELEEDDLDVPVDEEELDVLVDVALQARFFLRREARLLLVVADCSVETRARLRLTEKPFASRLLA